MYFKILRIKAIPGISINFLLANSVYWYMEIPPFLTEPITTDKIDHPVEEHLQELPYNKISWENFQRLVYGLAIKEKEVTDARSYGVQGNAQDGIDIYATSTAGNHTVYQCKKEKGFTPSKIIAAVALFLSKE